MTLTQSSLLLLGVLIAVIIYISYRFQKSSDDTDYFLGGRQLPAWLLAITFIASWWGGGSAIDLVDISNSQGISAFWIYGMSVLFSSFLLYLFAAKIRRIGGISQAQLMAKRYNANSGKILSVFIFISMILNAAIQIVVIGMFFQGFYGIPYLTSGALGLIVVLIYSYFGGFKAVVFTDLLQFIFFLISSLVLFYIVHDGFQGWEHLGNKALSLEKQGYLDFFYNWKQNLSFVITFGAAWMIQANVWQRISASKTPNDAKRMMKISFIAFFFLYAIVVVTGVLSLNQFEAKPEGGIVINLIKGLKNPWVASILFIGLCSAIMSTLDSLLNTAAMTFTVDLYHDVLRPKASDKELVWAGRMSTIIAGIAAFLIAYLIPSVLKISWIASDFITTGVFIPLILGFFWSRGSSRAANITMLFGLLFSLANLMEYLNYFNVFPWETASLTQVLVGLSASLMLYILISLLDKNHSIEKAVFFKKATENRDI
ncbi:MAG: sodium:solute symporter family protein [Flavobacteriaceae bacterium]